MFAELFEGLLLIVQWPSVLYLLAGVALGLVLGIVPGLGGITGMIVLLPLTFGMEPAAALAMLLGILAVGQTSDTVASVMLGIPGSVASQATILDGYPMAKKGLAQTALGAAYTVSAVGGVISAVVMAASLPILTWLVLAFGSPEFFLLALVGLVMVGAVSGNAVGKGVAAAAIGLLLSQIGYPVTSSTPRYWFGQPFLLDGLPLIPVVVGLFGIPEMMRLAGKGVSIAQQPDSEVASAQGDSIMAGIREAWKYKWLALRSSMLGTYIGILPGLGGSVVGWLAYGSVLQSAKDKSQFGKGDIRGVIAPEAANNAELGGAMIPTLAFGIPGSGSMAIFLGALTIHGFVPGREMLTTNLDITFSMIWALIIANVLGALVMMQWSRQVSKAAYVDGHLVVPAVIFFLFMGAWLVSPDMTSIMILLGAGLIGYVMKLGGWPRPPLILGFVLGPVMEEALSITAQSSTFFAVIQRPTIIVLAIILVFIAVMAVRSVWKRQGEAGVQVEASSGLVAGNYVSTILAVLSLGIFIYGYYAATGWTFLSRLFPMVICAAGIPLMLFVIWQDRVRIRQQIAATAGTASTGLKSTREMIYSERGEILAFLTFLGLAVAFPLIGQVPAIIGFIVFYLMVWGRYGIMATAIYAGVIGLFIYGLYHSILHVAFHPIPFWN